MFIYALNLYTDIKIAMYKLILFLLVLFSFPLFAGSKCQLEWDALKSVQNQLRQKSYEWLREKERRKHKDYQACRKGKNREKAQSRSTRTSQNYNKSKTALHIIIVRMRILSIWVMNGHEQMMNIKTGSSLGNTILAQKERRHLRRAFLTLFTANQTPRGFIYSQLNASRFHL